MIISTDPQSTWPTPAAASGSSAPTTLPNGETNLYGLSPDKLRLPGGGSDAEQSGGVGEGTIPA